MGTTYSGTIANDKITVDGKLASNDVIAYKTHNGSNYLAKISGNQIVHALNGDWSSARPSNIIDYVTSGGAKYTAKLENGKFLHALNSNRDFSNPRVSKNLDYIDWDSKPHYITLDEDLFLKGHSENINIVDGQGGDDEIHAYGGGYTIRGGDGDDTLQEISLGDNSNENVFDGGAGNDTIVAGAGDDQIEGGSGNDTLIGDAESTHIFDPAIAAHNGFDHEAGWSSFDQYPRQVADVNGDGRADIIGFGSKGVSIALGQADGTFRQEKLVIKNAFALGKNNGGWDSFNKYPRQVADVNGDGRADIIGFSSGGVGVQLGQADGTFVAAAKGMSDFSTGQGWRSFDEAPRHVADVNGDGRADIVGFHPDTIRVALGQADGSFSPGKNVGTDFTKTHHGWNSQDKYPRQVADVNGDGRADIIGFSSGNVGVALGRADGSFGKPIDASREFSQSSWVSFERSPRQVGDVNGDGRADIVGFGNDGVLVAFGQANGTFSPSVKATDQFSVSADGKSGWYSFNGFPRQVADVNGDGLDDIVAFSSVGVSVALSKGETQLPSKAGNDTLKGGQGDDILKGGGGKNQLYGGDGNDTFVLHKEGVQFIKDFKRGSDKIDAIGMNDRELKTFVEKQADNTYDTLISIDGKTIARVDNAVLSKPDFINLQYAGPKGPAIGSLSKVTEVLDDWGTRYAAKIGKGSFQLLWDNVNTTSDQPDLGDLLSQPTITSREISIKNNGPGEFSTSLSSSQTESTTITTANRHAWSFGTSIKAGITTSFKAGAKLVEAKKTASFEIGFSADYSGFKQKDKAELTSTTSERTVSVDALPNSVSTVKEYTAKYDFGNKLITQKHHLSGSVGIDFDGDQRSDSQGEVSVPISAILQYYSPDLFAADPNISNNKLFELPTGEKVVYTDKTTLTAVLSAGKGFDLVTSDAVAKTSFDRDLSGLSGNLLDERVDATQGTERFWLVRDNAYSDRSIVGPVIQGFSQADDFIGIDYQSSAGRDLTAEDVLIASPGNAAFKDHILLQDIQIGNEVATQIRMGGTGSSEASYSDNHILGTVIGVTPTSLQNRFKFDQAGTIYDPDIPQAV